MNVTHQREHKPKPPEHTPSEAASQPDSSGIRWPVLLLCAAIPLAVGGLIALLLGDSTSLYDTLVLPPLAPPGWLFPVVWSVLYLLMGIASYFVAVSPAEARIKKRALIAYGVQLAINALWSPLFFLWGQFSIAAAEIVLLMVAITTAMEQFARCSRSASRLLLPYLLWTAFAAYLNISIALLN